MQRFTLPRDIFFGEGALEHLKSLTGKKAFIVIGSERLIKDGTVAIVQAYLKEAKIESTVFSGVEADPSVETVMRGAAEMTKYQPDWIVGLGGGSPIDAAKAMWIFYENPSFTFEEAAKPFSLPTLRKKARFAAITTTSGTGTEVTAFSIISDEKTNVKYPIADFNITPDVAILDTSLVKGLTPSLIADTGMDALAHSLEAYVSKMANPITSALAMKSIEMVVDKVEASYRGDTEARSEMHIAQCMAGMAFSNAILGIIHSMAHKTGRLFAIPHGRANAILMPCCIEYNAKAAGSLYADIAKRLGLSGSTQDELVAALVQCIKKMRTAMKMPATLKEFGIDEASFLKQLPAIAQGALDDPCTGTNPRAIDAPTMERLLKAAYYGEKVDF